MTALATLADVAAVSRPVPSEDEARINRLIEIVSSAVQTYTHRTFVVVADDLIVLTPTRGVLLLPDPPIVSIASVAQSGITLVADVDYSFTPNGYVQLLTRPDQYWPSLPVTVVWTHGSDTVPDAIAGVVAEKVSEMRATGDARVANPTGAQSKQLGDWAVSFSGLAAGSGWAPEQLAVLDSYRRPGIA